jgi:8-oxo-dGTP pyrophosphatase MutT (NUDIX family)
MSKKRETSTYELAVVGSISQLLQDHAANPFQGIFSVAIRDGGYSTYYGGLPTEPENAAECWLMVLEATKVLQRLADQYTGGAPQEPEQPEKPHLTVIKGGKGRRKSKPKVATDPSADPAPPSATPKVKSVPHPKPGEHGKVVFINKPSKPTAPETWVDPKAIATATPGCPMPESLHGIPFAPWEDVPRTLDGWDDVDGQNWDVFNEEPELAPIQGKSVSAGAIIEEPDGRVWVVHPTNAFGGYQATFPKGGIEHLEMQPAAIKEAYEECGLKVEITGFVGDVERTTTVTRYYRARRVGGTPSAMGWESQAVSLVPREKLTEVLNKPVDHGLVAMLDHLHEISKRS